MIDGSLEFRRFKFFRAVADEFHFTLAVSTLRLAWSPCVNRSLARAPPWTCGIGTEPKWAVHCSAREPEPDGGDLLEIFTEIPIAVMLAVGIIARRRNDRADYENPPITRLRMRGVYFRIEVRPQVRTLGGQAAPSTDEPPRRAMTATS